MRSSNAPFNEQGFAEIIRDLERHELLLNDGGDTNPGSGADNGFADGPPNSQDVAGGLSSVSADLAALEAEVDAISGSVDGLGTMSSQDDSAVSITGGTVDGVAITGSTIDGKTPGATGLALLEDTTAAAGRLTLGLGDMATQDASAVAITGGTIGGLTGLATAASTTAIDLLFDRAGAAKFYADARTFVKCESGIFSASGGVDATTVGTQTYSNVVLSDTSASIAYRSTAGSSSSTVVTLSSAGIVATSPTDAFIKFTAAGSSGYSLLAHTSGPSVKVGAADLTFSLGTSGEFKVAAASGVSGVPAIRLYDSVGTGYSKLSSTELQIGSTAATKFSGSGVTLGSNLVLGPSSLSFGGTQVVSTQGASITAPSGGTTVDSQARTAINTIISRLVAHGLISA